MSQAFKNKTKYAVSRLFDGDRAIIAQENGKLKLKSDSDFDLSVFNDVAPIDDFMLTGHIVEENEDNVFYASDIAFFKENVAGLPWDKRYNLLRNNFDFNDKVRLSEPIVITDRDETRAVYELFSMLDHSKGAVFRDYSGDIMTSFAVDNTKEVENQEDLPEDEPVTPEAKIENPDYEFEPVPTQVVYASKARAMMRANDLGLDGVHEHEVDGTVMYMPGTTHQDWLDRLEGKN